MKASIHFQAANVAGKVVLDYARPALEGSEKQVAWATDIRAKFEAGAVDMLLRGAQVTVGAWLQTDDLSAEKAKIDATMDKIVGDKTFGDWLDNLFGKTSAKFWIDNRDAAVHKLLESAK